MRPRYLNRLWMLLFICLCNQRLGWAQFVFPQVVTGQVGDGTSYQSTISIFVNETAAPGVVALPATCTLQFYGLTPTITNVGSNTQFQVTIPKAGWLYLVTATSGSLQSGYATLSCPISSVYVTAYLQYTYYSSTGEILGEATVSGASFAASNSSQGTYSTQFIADQTGGGRVGVAIANDNVVPLAFAITAVDASGNSMSGPIFVVPAQASVGKFVDELMGTATDGLVLQVTITSSASFNPVALRYAGAVFSTIPSTN